MSLDQLRRLRRSGHRPDWVRVVVGKPPRWWGDDAAEVVIDRDPRDLDLRPMHGLRVELCDLQDDADRLFAAMDAIKAEGALDFGAVSAAGACGVNEEHERALVRWRRALMEAAR